MHGEQIPQTIVPRSPLIAIGRRRIPTVERLTKTDPLDNVKAHDQIGPVAAKAGQPRPREMLFFVELDDESRTRHIVIAWRHHARANEVSVAPVPAKCIENPLQDLSDARPRVIRGGAWPWKSMIDEATAIKSPEQFPDSQFTCAAMLRVSGRHRHPKSIVRKGGRDNNSPTALLWEDRDR